MLLVKILPLTRPICKKRDKGNLPKAEHRSLELFAQGEERSVWLLFDEVRGDGIRAS